MSTTIAITVVALVVAAVIWKVASGGLSDAKYSVRVTGEGVEGVQVKGDVPGKSEGAVQEFVAGLQLPKGARIWAVPDRDRVMLRFSAHEPGHLQQRLRTVFYD
jgi:hypothetical protein